MLVRATPLDHGGSVTGLKITNYEPLEHTINSERVGSRIS